MGLRDEFEEIQDGAEEAKANIESLWARKRGWVIAGMVFVLLALGFVLGRASTPHGAPHPAARQADEC